MVMFYERKDMPNNKPDLTKAQLFIDNTWIEDSIRVQRVFHQPKKYPRPVLEADRAHEGTGVVAYGSILFRENKFHAWYVTWDRTMPLKVCYAVSEDGIHFTKPDLGIYEAQGSKKNNICLHVTETGDEPGYIDNISVIEDPHDSKWPLKAIFYQGVPGKKELCGLVACRSQDGIYWDLEPGLVLPGYGDRTNAVATRINGKFVVLGRAPGNPYQCRCVWRTDSSDLVKWSKPELILKPGPEDDPHFQIYSATCFRYESIYLGFIERMHFQPDVLDSELICSHDSRRWQRPCRGKVFIPLGLPDTIDCAWASMPSSGPILYKNNLWFYYSGRPAAHHAPHPLACGAIGLGILRPDGFASLCGAHNEGWVLTAPMKWPAMDLLVNAAPRLDLSAHPHFSHGSVLVEARDAANKPLPGFGRSDCLPVSNTFHHAQARAPVSWKRNRSLRSLAGKTIRLAFFLRDAHLYSFCAGERPK